MRKIKRVCVATGGVVGGLFGIPFAVVGKLANNNFLQNLGDDIIDSAILTGSITGDIMGGGKDLIEGKVRKKPQKVKSGKTYLKKGGMRVIDNWVENFHVLVDQGGEIVQGVKDHDGKKVVRSTKKLAKMAAIGTITVGALKVSDVPDEKKIIINPKNNNIENNQYQEVLMKKIRLGKTELMVTKTSMGCLPIQRCSEEEAIRILRAAYEGGINYFDTANAYSDSEHKMGLALADVRKDIIISTKSTARDKAGVLAHIENSLRELKADYIDLFQFHIVPEVPDPNDPNGAYAGALEAKARGWIRHIGVTTHRVFVAEECIASGLFETLQFPFSYISSERDLALADKCKEADMGYIAMKGLAGGLLTNTRACYAFMNQYDNVVPIWGIQKLEELEQWLKVGAEDVKMTDELMAFIEKERKELSGSFCRSCGYCMPCTVGIDIRDCARMDMLLRRSPWKQYFTPEWQAKMAKISDCIECGKCSKACPYQLDTPNLLKYMQKDYYEFYEAHKDQL